MYKLVYESLDGFGHNKTYTITFWDLKELVRYIDNNSHELGDYKIWEDITWQFTD